MKEYRDGMVITKDEICNIWQMESFNSYTKAMTFVNPDQTLGVTFYADQSTGIIYRNE